MMTLKGESVVHFCFLIPLTSALPLIFLFSSQAAGFLEPFSSHFKEPLGYSIPALAYGTQLCTEFPPCCLRGYDYFNFYDDMVCPKLLMNVTVSFSINFSFYIGEEVL